MTKMADLGEIKFLEGNDTSFNIINVEGKPWLLTTEGAIMLSQYYGVGNTLKPIHITFFPFIMSPTNDYQIHLKVMNDLCDVQHETNGDIKECHTLLVDGGNTTDSVVVTFTKDIKSKEFAIETSSSDALVITQDENIANLSGTTLSLTYIDGIEYPQHIKVSNYCGNINITVLYDKGTEGSCFLSVSQNKLNFEYNPISQSYEPSYLTFSVNSSSDVSYESLSGFTVEHNISEYKITPKNNASDESLTLFYNCNNRKESLTIDIAVTEKDVSDVLNCNESSISLDSTNIRYDGYGVSSSITVNSVPQEFDFSVDDRLIVTKHLKNNGIYELTVSVTDALLDYVKKNEECTIYDAIVVFNECGKRASCDFEITDEYVPQSIAEESNDTETEDFYELRSNKTSVTYASNANSATVTSLVKHKHGDGTEDIEPINWWFENVSVFPSYELIYNGELTSGRKLFFGEPPTAEGLNENDNNIYVRCKQSGFSGNGQIKIDNGHDHVLIDIIHQRSEEKPFCDFTEYEIIDFEIG